MRYGERHRSPHFGATGDTRRNARTRERGKHAVHWSIERGRAIRVGPDSAMVRHGAGGGSGRRRHNPDFSALAVAFPVAPRGRQIEVAEVVYRRTPASAAGPRAGHWDLFKPSTGGRGAPGGGHGPRPTTGKPRAT